MDHVSPTPDEVAQAQADYHRALSILIAATRADEDIAKRALLGKCFKYLTGDDDGSWPVYVAVTGIDDPTGRLVAWHFSQAITGQIVIGPIQDFPPAFVRERPCHPIPREELIVAFNELLTRIARYAATVPV